LQRVESQGAGHTDLSQLVAPAHDERVRESPVELSAFCRVGRH
jgi:hypothetical protein